METEQTILSLLSQGIHPQETRLGHLQCHFALHVQDAQFGKLVEPTHSNDEEFDGVNVQRDDDQMSNSGGADADIDIMNVEGAAARAMSSGAFTYFLLFDDIVCKCLGLRVVVVRLCFVNVMFWCSAKLFEYIWYYIICFLSVKS